MTSRKCLEIIEFNVKYWVQWSPFWGHPSMKKVADGLIVKSDWLNDMPWESAGRRAGRHANPQSKRLRAFRLELRDCGQARLPKKLTLAGWRVFFAYDDDSKNPNNPSNKMCYQICTPKIQQNILLHYVARSRPFLGGLTSIFGLSRPSQGWQTLEAWTTQKSW